MNVRTGALGISVLALLVGGCAAGGAPGAVMPEPVADEDLPAWVLALPEGELSRDNDETARAALFLAQGAFDQALESAQAGMQFDPMNPQSFLQAGQAYLGLEDLEAADQMFTQVEVLSPRAILEVNFYRQSEWIEGFNSAVSAMEAGDTEGAMAGFERAHTIYQGRPEAMVQLGALYRQDGRLEDALELFAQTVELIEGPVGQREEDPEVIATNAENLSAARFIQGELLLEFERFPEAAAVYGQIVEADPDNLIAYSNYGMALISAGENERASEVYAGLFARPGLTVVDYNRIAVGAYNGDLFLQAAAAFGRAREVFPENRDFIFNQAQSLYLQVLELGDQAQELASQMEELAGGPPEELADVESQLADVEPQLADVASMLVDAATELVESETYNRVAYQFLIQALIRLDRQEEAGAAADDFTALPFDIGELQFARADGSYVLRFVLTNRTRSAGDTVDVRFRIYDRDRLAIGTPLDVSIPLDAVGVALESQVDFVTPADAIGYNYEVLQLGN